MPSALGEVAIDTANAVVGGIEQMINGSLKAIQDTIQSLEAMAVTSGLLPFMQAAGWKGFTTIEPVSLGRIDSPFGGGG